MLLLQDFPYECRLLRIDHDPQPNDHLSFLGERLSLPCLHGESIWYPSLALAPTYHLFLEAILIICIIKLLFSKSYNPEKTILTEKEKNDLLADWKPEPLVPHVKDDHPLLEKLHNSIVLGKAGKYIDLNGNLCLNLATFNFLGMLGEERIEEEAKKTLRHYGVGSCGPRAFYGTMDLHLFMEEQLQKFMEVESTILYCYGFATIASAIPAYAKRGDVIFCDEGACFSILKGLLASRSEIRYFRHNDMEHLEELLIQQQKEEQKNPKKAKITRKFITVEGVYMNYGDICPLPQILEFKYKYKVRIFLEESFSLGVFGKNGRGLTEHFGIPIEEIDFLAASLENAFASTGGLCVGKKYVIDHQRLSGLGYCFSASQPPLCVTAAIEAFRMVEENPDIIKQLRDKCEEVHEKLTGIEGLELCGAPTSPVKHLRLIEPSDDRDIDERTLQKIVEMAHQQKIGLTVAQYLVDEEHNLPKPSIRISVNRKLTTDDVNKTVSVIKQVANEVLFSSES